MQAGVILFVNTTLGGSELLEDHTAGSTVLGLADVVDFQSGDEGGTCEINGTQYDYDGVDEDLLTITITPPLAEDLLVSQAVNIWPHSPLKQATVEIEDDDDPVLARVPQGLHDRLPDGVREPESQEACVLEYREDQWIVSDVEDEVVEVDGTMVAVRDGHLPVYDENGVLRTIIGFHEDGTYTVTDVNGPQPPTPAEPTVTTQPGLLVVSSYGLTANGDPWPSDFRRLDVHVSSSASFTPSTATRVNEFSMDGGSVSLALAPGTTFYVKLVAVSTSGTPSAPSSEASATVPEPLQGADGQTLYTWIKYADDSSGTGLSNDPTGKEYIGLAHNQTTDAESTDPLDYAWSLIKGDQGPQGVEGPEGPEGPQGVPGPPGEDGQPTYTWIKYADTPTSGMSDDPTGKEYIGIAHNKTTASESTAYGDYSWSLVKGADGSAGADGIGVSSTTVTYTKSASGTTAPSSGWTSSIPATSEGEFLWTRTVTTYTDSSTSTAYSVAAHGAQGPTGSTGPAGSDGVGVSSTAVDYAKNTSGTTPPSSWSTSIPATSPGEYMWTRTITTYTDASTSPAAYAVAKHGDTGAQGVQGPAGEDGQPTYTWIKYAPNGNPTNAQISNDPTGMTHIGLAYNKSTQTESSTASDYTWALIQGPKGDTGDTGSEGPQGDQGVSVTGVTLYWALVSDTSPPPAEPTTATPPSPWQATEPAFTLGTDLYTVERVDYSSGTFSYTTVALSSSYEAAKYAQETADGKNTVYYDPTRDGTKVGDILFDQTNGFRISEWDGTSWVPHELGTEALESLAITAAKIADAAVTNAKIANLDAGKITTGILNAARIAAGAIDTTHLAADAVTADEIAADAITAKHTITGALFRTAATGPRWELASAAVNTLLSFSGELGETPGGLTIDSDSNGIPWMRLRSGYTSDSTSETGLVFQPEGYGAEYHADNHMIGGAGGFDSVSSQVPNLTLQITPPDRRITAISDNWNVQDLFEVNGTDTGYDGYAVRAGLLLSKAPVLDGTEGSVTLYARGMENHPGFVYEGGTGVLTMKSSGSLAPPGSLESQSSDANGPLIDLNADGSGRIGPVEWDGASTHLTLIDEAWHTVGAAGEPGFINGWSAFSEPVEFRKDAAGTVWLRGRVAGGSTGTAPFVLPAGYRPSADHIGGNTAYAHIDGYATVEPRTNGDLRIAYKSGTEHWVALAGQSFTTL